MSTFTFTLEPWTLAHIGEVFFMESPQLVLGKEVEEAVTRCRTYLENKIKADKKAIYGVNTGFGSLSKVKVDDTRLEQLQANLLRSHACGTGEEVPQQLVRMMIFLKIRSLSFGHSGVRLEVLQRLADFFNHGITPVVYTQGSLGASGDLAPLSHLCLPLMGEGEVYLEGKKMPASEALKVKGLQPLTLQSKEGLALINGTQFMLAYALYLALEARILWNTANHVAAAGLEAFDGCLDAFRPEIHRIRPHQGQKETAAHFMKMLHDSAIMHAPVKPDVQDPYSFRCIPQVHGASKDVIENAIRVFETELNSATDNPNIFPDEDMVLSGGNFHGQPLALQLDFLTLALSELGSISERRVFLLLSGDKDRKLPPFLTRDPGLESGCMILQYTAAAITSENKTLCMPSSADSITSSNGKEDHVSMGANAAVKCRRVAENVKTLLGIELLVASQAMTFRDLAQVSTHSRQLLEAFRSLVPPNDGDQIWSGKIAQARTFIDR